MAFDENQKNGDQNMLIPCGAPYGAIRASLLRALRAHAMAGAECKKTKRRVQRACSRMADARCETMRRAPN